MHYIVLPCLLTEQWIFENTLKSIIPLNNIKELIIELFQIAWCKEKSFAIAMIPRLLNNNPKCIIYLILIATVNQSRKYTISALTIFFFYMSPKGFRAVQVTPTKPTME